MSVRTPRQDETSEETFVPEIAPASVPQGYLREYPDLIEATTGKTPHKKVKKQKNGKKKSNGDNE
ncbi:MAG: hypothetical protein QY314_03975 [Candidatus Dojkabacteria bacterium]|nr:MAG: hypothetical protein QY314_03975 [Candidatus Dojkabacteria bacterium]